MTEDNRLLKEHGINIASLAVQAMLYEASCTPSPGLVSLTSSGAHTDMDYFTFLDSATSLLNPLIHCTEAGFSSKSPPEIFQQLRVLGKLGEQRMLAKTFGVNTHKGMLFLPGNRLCRWRKGALRGYPLHIPAKPYSRDDRRFGGARIEFKTAGV